MKKIITAINNPQLNEELKKEKNFEIIGKDIQYKEAILEILEENDFIDCRCCRHSWRRSILRNEKGGEERNAYRKTSCRNCRT